tara:strand:+ start:2490 stop:3113 length:624 start_codon:yes stop_codon:yes gene_type:complete
MDQEALKRVKQQKERPSKMFVDSEAVVLSVIPFLDAVDLKEYLAINWRMRDTYDIAEVWRKAVKQFLNVNRRVVLNYSGIELKKCIHFKQLSRKYTLPTLMEEVTNHEQLQILLLYVNKAFNYTPNAKHVMRIMIGFLAPDFLRHVFIHYPHFPFRNMLPHKYEHHVTHMNTINMFQLGKCIDSNPYNPKTRWDETGDMWGDMEYHL